MTTSPQGPQPTLVEVALNYNFSSRALLEQALTHKSFSNERRLQPGSDNERLEFLGDSVLSLSLSQLLMSQTPFADEGLLSRRRAALVNEESLAKLASELGVGVQLRLGKGELASGGATKPRLLASALEAVLGAIFLDAGYEKVSSIIQNLFKSSLSALEALGDFTRDHKTRLQELAQKQWGQAPVYKLVSAEGPEHAKQFRIEVSVEGVEGTVGEGRSKKIAEQAAAHAFLQRLELEPNLKIQSNGSPNISTVASEGEL